MRTDKELVEELASRVREFWVRPFESSAKGPDGISVAPLVFEPAAVLSPGKQPVRADDFSHEFDRADSRLVISGAGGAGKSFAMVLNIVQPRLVASPDAARGNRRLVPVVFDASSFLGDLELYFNNTPGEAVAQAFHLPVRAETRLFFRWVRRQLNGRYGFRQEDAQRLIDLDVIEG
jgi:hypothetical protein